MSYIDVFSPSIKEFRNPADRNRDKSLQQSPRLKKPFKRIASYLKPQRLKIIKENTTTESDVSRTSIQLTSLPAELLLMIISHLDIVNQVCLQITCRFFRAFIIVDRIALEHDRCRKWAITCFLEGDMDKYPAKIACAFCKTVRPVKQFRGYRHGLGLWYCLRHPGVFQRCSDMMTAVPVDRFCNRHRKDCFTRDYTLRTSEGTPVRRSKDPTPRWIQLRIFRCWHCASVIGFDDKREAGCLNCLCDFCPRLKCKHFFRVGSCRPSEGLYMWDGPCNVSNLKIGGRIKKTVKRPCVREVGGRVVVINGPLGDDIYYV